MAPKSWWLWAISIHPINCGHKILPQALSHSSFFQRCRNPPSSKPLHSSFFQRCLSSLSDLTPATHRHQSANSGQQSGAGRQKFTGNDDAQVKGARSGTALNIDSERKNGNAALNNGCRWEGHQWVGQEIDLFHLVLGTTIFWFIYCLNKIRKWHIA
jgi:hypothetical protein